MKTASEPLALPLRDELARLGRDRFALVVLGLALALRLAFFAEVWRHDLDLSKNPMLDMIYLQQNAREIASGDVLLREQFLGNYARMRSEMYGPARYDRLFAPHSYHDSPGYLYFAGLCEVGTGSPYAVVFVQEVLDAIGCALVYVLARRAAGLAAGRLALVAAALCLESVGHAGFVLRESFLALLATALVLAVDEARRTGRERTWAGAGVVFGVAWLSKLTFSLAVPFLVWAAVSHHDDDARHRGRHRRGARRLAAFALGAVLSLTPLVVRNVALGVSPLQTSVVGPALMVQRNMPGYSGAAEHQDHAQVQRILERADDTTAGAWLATVESYVHPDDYLRLEWRKARFFWSDVDWWNDIAVSWLRPLSPPLRLCVVEWGVLAPWAALGVLHSLVVRERRRALFPHLVIFLTLGLATALLSGVYTRYRLVVEPIACVFFAIAVVETAWAIRQRKLAGPIALALALALHVKLHDPHTPEERGLTRRHLHGYVEGTWTESATARAYWHQRIEESSLPE